MIQVIEISELDRLAQQRAELLRRVTEQVEAALATLDRSIPGPNDKPEDIAHSAALIGACAREFADVTAKLSDAASVLATLARVHQAIAPLPASERRARGQ